MRKVYFERLRSVIQGKYGYNIVEVQWFKGFMA